MINIYLITNNAVSPKMYYVGRTKKPLDERLTEHVRMASRNFNRLLHESILEYGKRNFTIELLEVVEDDISYEIEEKYIRKYNSHYIDGFGYNMRYESITKDVNYYGADKEVVKNNILKGNAWNKGISLSKEVKSKVSKTKKRRFELGKYKNYGHKHTEETKSKLSKIAKNRKPISSETREKLRKQSSDRSCYYNEKEKKRVFIKNSQTIPEGYIKGKGTCWVNNGKENFSIHVWDKEDYFKRGYFKGRIVYVGKNIKY